MLELSLHILDIARNSIEAGAREITISVVEKVQADTLLFTVRDNGPGVERGILPHLTDPFYTTKEKNKKIGLGLSLLKAAAERCDGAFEIDSSPGEGTAVTAVFRRSHIDRSPLGDMAGTLAILMTGPELEDLTYCHEFEGKRFAFNLKAFKNHFEGITPGHPAVFRLLRDYLEEGIGSLYGGVNDEIPGRTGEPA